MDGNRLAATLAAPLAALGLVAAGSASTGYDARLAGTEVPPITSTLGTFVGGMTGELTGTWRVQIRHEPLAPTPVRITGGTFSIRTISHGQSSGRVTGGSVAPVGRGSNCTNQTFRVTATFTSGSFEGTLTHRRKRIYGRCVIYAATIAGRGVFNL